MKSLPQYTWSLVDMQASFNPYMTQNLYKNEIETKVSVSKKPRLNRSNKSYYKKVFVKVLLNNIYFKVFSKTCYNNSSI